MRSLSSIRTQRILQRPSVKSLVFVSSTIHGKDIRKVKISQTHWQQATTFFPSMQMKRCRKHCNSPSSISKNPPHTTCTRSHVSPTIAVNGFALADGIPTSKKDCSKKILPDGTVL